MPSIGTSILSARVKDETLMIFKGIAKEHNTTVANILNALCGFQHDDAVFELFELVNEYEQRLQD